MDHNTLEKILGLVSMIDPSIQRIQTAHRLKLADKWAISPGERVLELGCGQGDTTAVLAYLVGEDGFVYGIDIASPEYGAPITLGQAAEHLLSSNIGNRIRIDFNTDVLSSELDFPADSFDTVVMSHCSWYFRSQEELASVLSKTRKWAKRLCFAEWDPRITSIEQYPHLLAVLLQAQIECFKVASEANVRTFVTPDDLVHIAEAAGWQVDRKETMESDELQDGWWEVQIALIEQRMSYMEIQGMPDKLKQLVSSEYGLLEAAIKDRQVKALGTFLFIAE